MPLLEVECCNSETFRKPVKFKLCKVWNSLPIHDSDSGSELDDFVTLSEFNDQLYKHIVETRKSLWFSFD
jgi:hypothetical protein